MTQLVIYWNEQIACTDLYDWAKMVNFPLRAQHTDDSFMLEYSGLYIAQSSNISRFCYVFFCLANFLAVVLIPFRALVYFFGGSLADQLTRMLNMVEFEL